jgi:hypothetical protein
VFGGLEKMGVVVIVKNEEGEGKETFRGDEMY